MTFCKIILFLSSEIILATSVHQNDIEVPGQLARCQWKGLICGDKCLTSKGFMPVICKCGQEEFDDSDDSYCCVSLSKTEACLKGPDGNVTCPKGDKRKFYQPCHNQCPINVQSYIAMEWNCSQFGNGGQCPPGDSYSKVCVNDEPSSNLAMANKSFEESFCNQGTSCPPNSNDIKQCFFKRISYIYNSQSMTCLSRMDKNKNAAQEIKRMNLFSLIKVQNFSIICSGKNEIYPLHEMCAHSNSRKQPCTLENGLATVELNPFYPASIDLCWDYSFWTKNQERCLNVNNYVTGELLEKTHPSICSNKQEKCSMTWFRNGKYCQNSATLENCQNEDQFFCNQSKTCLPIGKMCDGIVHCIEGEDETFEACQDTFPKEATIKCIEDRANGVDIMIMAIPCDGIKECRNGEDEDCKISGRIFWSILILFYVITVVIFVLMKFSIKKWKNGLGLVHIVQTKREVVWTHVKCKAMKGDDLANLKNETSQLLCAQLLSSEGHFSKVKKSFKRVVSNEYVRFLSEPAILLYSQMDILKDNILVWSLCTYLGGILIVFQNPQLFSSNVIFLLLLTTFGPQLLAAARFSRKLPNALTKTRLTKILSICLVFLGASFALYCQKLRFTYLTMKVGELENPHDESLVSEWESSKRTLHEHMKLELGLETIYQLAGQIILLSLAYSETRTNEGLSTVFKEIHKEDEDHKHLLEDPVKYLQNVIGISQSTMTKVLLIISIMLSFFSCIKSHLKAVSACRERFPTCSKIIAGLYSFFGCTTRVLAIVLFFAVPLGLFDLLRHLQGEQVPWNPVFVANFIGSNATGEIVVGNSEPTNWKIIDRWNKNFLEKPFIYEHQWDEFPEWNSKFLLSPPDYTAYTFFSLHQYFLLFVGQLSLHITFVYFAKKVLSTHFRLHFNGLEQFIHCLENTNIPYNAREWDDAKGNATKHRKRMAANWKEIMAVNVIKSIFNIVLLLPIFYLVYKMEERHEILEKSIGCLAMEIEALERGRIIRDWALIYLVVGSILELIFFKLYNGCFHPFANILKDPNVSDYSYFKDLQYISKRNKNFINGCILDSDNPRKKIKKESIAIT